MLWIPKLSGHPRLDCDPLILGMYTMIGWGMMNTAGGVRWGRNCWMEGEAGWLCKVGVDFAEEQI